MRTIDRINALRRRLKFSTETSLSEIYGDGLIHDELDVIDKHTGIITRHGFHNIYGTADNAPLVQEYVGARLTRLERHIEKNFMPPFFWLGEAARA